MKLHELLAVEGDHKNALAQTIERLLSLFTRGVGQLQAQYRTYKPLAEDGDKFPAESTELATTVDVELISLKDAAIRAITSAIRKEETNVRATAKVSFGAELEGGNLAHILPELSAPSLLNLESKLQALRRVYEAIPTLDLSEKWEPAQYALLYGEYTSAPAETPRTKKTKQPLIVVPATKEHPAQATLIDEDIRIGTWTTQKRSGCWSPSQKRETLERLDEVIAAVKMARHRANEAQVVQIGNIAEIILRYVQGE